MKKLPIKILEGNKINLLPFSKKFISNEYLSWIKDKEVTKFINKANNNTSLKDLKSFAETLIKSKFDYFFAIIFKMKKLHIGNVRLGPIDSQFKKSNFGILIGNKNFHGQGVATEVLELIKRFSFDYLKLDKIYFPVVEENAAAMNLYAKSKFVCSGEMKKKFIKNKKSFKLIKWTMSKLDYKKEKKNA